MSKGAAKNSNAAGNSRVFMIKLCKRYQRAGGETILDCGPLQREKKTD